MLKIRQLYQIYKFEQTKKFSSKIMILNFLMIKYIFLI